MAASAAALLQPRNSGQSKDSHTQHSPTCTPAVKHLMLSRILKISTHLNHFKHPKCNNQLQHLKHLGDFKHLNYKTYLNSRSRSACGDPQALTCSRLLGCVTHHECIVCIAQRLKTEKSALPKSSAVVTLRASGEKAQQQQLALHQCVQ